MDEWNYWFVIIQDQYHKTQTVKCSPFSMSSLTSNYFRYSIRYMESDRGNFNLILVMTILKCTNAIPILPFCHKFWGEIKKKSEIKSLNSFFSNQGSASVRKFACHSIKDHVVSVYMYICTYMYIFIIPIALRLDKKDLPVTVYQPHVVGLT